MLWCFCAFAKFAALAGRAGSCVSGGVATDNLRFFGLPKRRTVLGGMAALAAAPALAADGPEVKLRLLETSDLHTFDAAYDYFRDQPDASVGLTRVATLIRAARARRRMCCCSIMGILSRAIRWRIMSRVPGNFPGDGVHPTIRAMNTLGYDAATVGNHEFNYGLDFCPRGAEGGEISVLRGECVQCGWHAFFAADGDFGTAVCRPRMGRWCR